MFISLKISFKRSWFTHGSLLFILSLFDYQDLDAQGIPPNIPSSRPCPGVPVRDIDGNTYNTLQIDTQCWMRDNLKVSKYRNGNPIATGLDNSAWSNTTFGAYAIYGNYTANEGLYGKLYNWFAVADNRGLCPTGWHVPTNAEWTTLTTFLGGESVAGSKMKSTGTTYWNGPNRDATNASGFTALPGGYRNRDGHFFYIRYNAFFWSTTEIVYYDAYFRFLNNYNGSVFSDFSHSYFYKQNGFSVRCLRD